MAEIRDNITKFHDMLSKYHKETAEALATEDGSRIEPLIRDAVAELESDLDYATISGQAYVWRNKGTSELVGTLADTSNDIYSFLREYGIRRRIKSDYFNDAVVYSGIESDFQNSTKLARLSKVAE